MEKEGGSVRTPPFYRWGQCAMLNSPDIASPGLVPDVHFVSDYFIKAGLSH